MKSRLQYFLLQVNEYGSKQILDSGIYQHLDWYANKKDRAHGDVRVGDVILVYFTSNALLFKKTLKMIYKVTAITKDHARFRLKEERELNGLTLDIIQELIKKIS